jgi:hypothetical protein
MCRIKNQALLRATCGDDVDTEIWGIALAPYSVAHGIARAKQRRLAVPSFQTGKICKLKNRMKQKQEFEDVELVRYHRTVLARGVWRARG